MTPILPTTKCSGCHLDGKTRCGACFKSTGQLVRYCGPECQATMWKVHRHYCGKPPAIFYQPSLEKYEVSLNTLYNAIFAPETLLDYKPADLSMPFKDAVLKLDLNYNNSPWAKRRWEQHQADTETMSPSAVQVRIMTYRVNIARFWISRAGDKGAIENYPYSSFGLVLSMPEIATQEELPHWRAIMSDFNYACLAFCVVEEAILAKTGGKMTTHEAAKKVDLWARMMAACEVIRNKGEEKFMRDFLALHFIKMETAVENP